MGDRHAQPLRVAREARERLLNAMSLHHGASSSQIARVIEKNAGTVDQMLRALEVDGCVWRQGSKWLRTDKPLPAIPTSTASMKVTRTDAHEGPRYDASGLLSLWGKWGGPT